MYQNKFKMCNFKSRARFIALSSKNINDPTPTNAESSRRKKSKEKKKIVM
ncbi:MAG: hypothetical protein ACI8RD_003355 [Bacillariaceae sp.]|jgi:hypothetical protein